MKLGAADRDNLSAFDVSESDEQLAAFRSETDEVTVPPTVSTAARAVASGEAHGHSALVGGVVLLAMVAFGILAVVWWEQGTRQEAAARRTTSQAAAARLNANGNGDANATGASQPAPPPQVAERQPDPGQAGPVGAQSLGQPPVLEAMRATPEISFRATEAVAVAPGPDASRPGRTSPGGAARPAATPDTAVRGGVPSEAASEVVPEAPRAAAPVLPPLASPESAVAAAPALVPAPVPAPGAVAPVVRPPAASRPVDRAAGDRAAIGGVLDQYRESYNSLDATSASTIWQGLDTRALQRAFSTLSSQDVSFDRCDVTVVSDARATAVCRGVLSYVQKIGDGAQQQRRLSWTIDFQRTADRWLIAGVTAR